MKKSDRLCLQRLLRPQTIAVVGGKHASRVIRQCDKLGFKGEIWAVNPSRNEMESRRCFRSVDELPAPPDAAFLGVAKEQTVELVGQLAMMGAGGVVCYASGFAETGEKGLKLQQTLDESRGDMPIIGPNCYGVLNYQDGVALWPDEQGGQRCQRGVGIVSQSGNITVSLTMQRRSLPVTYLISTGNMVGAKTHHYIQTMLNNPDVTAIGLYLEGLAEIEALSKVAIEALRKRVPIVVLESGKSEIGSQVTHTHSYSLSSDSHLSKAFYEHHGMIQVENIPQLLETLKLVSQFPPTNSATVATISCSGGEAALVADLVSATGLEFEPFSKDQCKQLHSVLGDKVVISNPLDYHTYIWGDKVSQKACFQSVYEGAQAITVNILDFPTPGVCDSSEWDSAVDAIVEAKQCTGAKVAVVATLHENFPYEVQHKLVKRGIAPMLGLSECMSAIASSVKYARRAEQVQTIKPLSVGSVSQGIDRLLSEFQGKALLKSAGLSVVEGALADSKESAFVVAKRLKFPIVAKISSITQIHKSEIGGVVTAIESRDTLFDAIGSLQHLGSEFLIEKHLAEPAVELIVGYRRHPVFGSIFVIGAGGKLANLMEDTAIIYFPVDRKNLIDRLSSLKVGRLLNQYRDIFGDLDAVVDFLIKLASHIEDASEQISEIEINPLFVYPKGEGVVAVDVVYRYC